jgi:hypothetical protein
MNRPRWNPDLAGNARTLLLVAVLLAVVGAAFIFVPSPSRNFNAGFGPEWECAPQAQGGPTCIKKIGRQNQQCVCARARIS